MKLHQIRNLVAVAERGSLRRAAHHLGVSQPSLTRSIQELEHELDVTLFERGGTGMVLTAAGAIVLRRATGIQAELARVHEEVAHLRGVARGSVAIGLSTVSHIALLPRVLPTFMQRFPDLRLRITETLFTAVERDIRDGLLDFYIGPLGQDASPMGLSVEPLFRNTRMVFARSGHPLAGARSLGDLVSQSWVTGALTLISEDELTPIFTRLGLPRPNVVVEGRTSLTKIAVASSSDLLIMLPRQWKAPLEATGLIREIPVVEPLEAQTICIIRRSSRPLTPTSECLSDLFRRAAVAYARATPDVAVLTA